MPRISREGLMSISRNSVLFVLFCIAFSGFAFSQTQITTGVIQGTVLDPTGAVIPGAEVTAKNLNTQVETTHTTDGDGRFVFLSLAPGRYSVAVSRTSFSKVIQKDIDLTVGQ